MCGRFPRPSPSPIFCPAAGSQSIDRPGPEPHPIPGRPRTARRACTCFFVQTKYKTFFFVHPMRTARSRPDRPSVRARQRPWVTPLVCTDTLLFFCCGPLSPSLWRTQSWRLWTPWGRNAQKERSVRRRVLPTTRGRLWQGEKRHRAVVDDQFADFTAPQQTPMQHTRTHWDWTSESSAAGRGLETHTSVRCRRIEAGEFECTYKSETRGSWRQVCTQKARWRMRAGTGAGDFPAPEEVKARLSEWDAVTGRSCVAQTDTGAERSRRPAAQNVRRLLCPTVGNGQAIGQKTRPIPPSSSLLYQRQSKTFFFSRVVGRRAGPKKARDAWAGMARCDFFLGRAISRRSTAGTTHGRPVRKKKENRNRKKRKYSADGEPGDHRRARASRTPRRRGRRRRWRAVS